MFIDLQCVELTNSEHNAGQPREIMRIIVLEQCIRLIFLLYACLPFNAVALAFIIDTNQSIIRVWVGKCWLHITIFGVVIP